MNACIAQARGSNLMILSDDNQIQEGYVAEIMDILQRHPAAKVCLGRQQRISERDAGLVSVHPAPELSQRRQVVMDGVEYLRDSLSGALKTGVLTNISLFAWRGDIVEAGAFRHYPDGSHAENYLAMRLALTGQVSLACSIMYYRVYASSSGLGTPFGALLTATRHYIRDCRQLMHDKADLSRADRRRITRSLKDGAASMLASRVRTVYRPRISGLRYVGLLLRVLAFKATPTERV